ncbi:MAG: ATP-dependent DNA ligase [Balneolales bacterium]|nr:ATP-dependent DNA ligase [Balneolales bacterium]
MTAEKDETKNTDNLADSLGKESFHHFCMVIQQIAETRGSLAKARLFASYIKTLSHNRSIQLAAQFAGEGAFSNVSGRRVSAGHRTVAVAAASFCEIDYDLVFKACRTATGSASETIEKLMENLPAAISKRKPSLRSLEEAELLFSHLEKERTRDGKHQLLQQIWSEMTSLEIKYFIRIMGQGSLRIGFESKSIINALATAFAKEPEEVRYAHMITGSLASTAKLCKEDRLEEARFQLFQPIAFMLASPIESRSIEDISAYIAEEKFDGMRCQLHANSQNVKLFSRDLNDITNSFPDLAANYKTKNLPDTVLDGEICVFKSDKIQPFQLLQKRMGLKKPSSVIIAKHPVIFIAYDLLYYSGKALFDHTLQTRRQHLHKLAESFSISVSKQFPVADTSDVERLFDRALAFGNEGLMLKHKQSTYEYGQRRKSWLKVKKPGGSLDTVIMYAHAGSGKRGGTYSDFTLGISVKADERYEEEFIPIGKAYGGYTDEELKKLNRAMKPLIVDRFGPTYSLKPGIVVEIEFDDIQINKRTKAGYTLRFPRFKAIRWDLSPADADTLKDVEQLYSQKLNRQIESQQRHQSFITY